MTPAQAQGAVQVVGAVAALGLFLPSIDKTWDESDSEAAYRCRTGECVYLGATAAITLTASYAYGSMGPFVVGMGLALVIVAFQEHALRHVSTNPSDD
jgi:hypothetical protein